VIDMMNHFKTLRVLRIAHKGAPTQRPENTLSAFFEAVEKGADLIEMDIQRTKDSHLVVLHDETLDRTTDGSGLVREICLSELKGLSAGAWFDEAFANERVPTLEEALACLIKWYDKEGVIACIDLKDPNDVDALHSLLCKKGWVSRVIVSSVFHDALRELKKSLGGLPTAADFEEPLAEDEYVERTLQAMSNVLMIEHHFVTPKLIDQATRAGLPVWTWIVNDSKSLQELIDLGVAGIMTDDLEVFFQPPNALSQEKGTRIVPDSKTKTLEAGG